VCIPYGVSIAINEGFDEKNYYHYQVEYAYEEKAIGEIIANSPNSTVFQYHQNDLGSIEFYGKIPFTKSEYVYTLSDTSNIVPNSFVITPDSEDTLSTTFPQYKFTRLYAGAYVSLFTVSR
jgi:hypothetical protein